MRYGFLFDCRQRFAVASIEQVSSWCISSILRAETKDGRVFFKATAPSPLFVDEGTVTQRLAVMFPGRVPLPIAVDPDRRWMLLDDFGPVVGWNADLETRTAVLSTFARMQLETTSQQDELLASLNQAISYRSIAANVERGAAPEFESMIPYWLRKALVSSENT